MLNLLYLHSNNNLEYFAVSMPEIISSSKFKYKKIILGLCHDYYIV